MSSPETQPSITPPQQEALQEFSLSTDTAAAHTEALKEYRQRDHADYMDHIASLSTSDDGVTDTDYFSRQVRVENFRADAAEKVEAIQDRARDIGGMAIVLATGVGTIAREAANQKLFSLQYAYSERKHQRHNARIERKDAKQQQKQARKDTRAQHRQERHEQFHDSTIGRARRIGHKALTIGDKIYQAGLDTTDEQKGKELRAAKAKAERQKLDDIRRERVDNALSNVDMSLQGKRIHELLVDETAHVYETVESDTEPGFLSDTFSSNVLPDTPMVVFYKKMEDGQLFPQLLMKNENGWRKASGLWHESYKEDTTIDAALSEKVDQLLARSKDASRQAKIPANEFTQLIDKLTFKRPEPAKSMYRKKREELLKAKKQVKQRQHSTVDSSEPTGSISIRDNRAVQSSGYFPSKKAA